MGTPLACPLYPVSANTRSRLTALSNKLPDGMVGRLTDEETVLIGRGDTSPVLELPSKSGIATMISTALSGTAAASHTHSGYAATSHTHTEYAATSHTHSGYAATSHTHTEYAATSHTHSTANVNGLDTALAGKAAASHTHTEYAATSHTHSASQITGLAQGLGTPVFYASVAAGANAPGGAIGIILPGGYYATSASPAEFAQSNVESPNYFGGDNSLGLFFSTGRSYFYNKGLSESYIWKFQ